MGESMEKGQSGLIAVTGDTGSEMLPGFDGLPPASMANSRGIILYRSRPRTTDDWRLLFALCSVLSALFLISCNDTTEEPERRDYAITKSEYSGHLPPEADWIDIGPIFMAGEAGEWDHYLWGGFASAVLKIDETYYLYYQGASSYRYAFDETVCGRAIGVATSRNGISFEKFEGNPVITWAPNKECEEGAASLALATDHNGDILAFYGANTALDSRNVNADARLARSPDGLNFHDEGIVLDHKDSTVWGSGDELFPITAAYTNGMWLLYYLPNKKGFTRKLGVAWGNSPFELEHSSAVMNQQQETVSMWGTGSHIKATPHTDTLTLFNNQEDKLQTWSISSGSPQNLGNLLASHTLENAGHAVVMLDRKRRTWFLYYQVGDMYRVKVAPYGKPDASAPSPPDGIRASRVNATRIELSWLPSVDSETGVATYNIYRNGALVSSVTGTAFADAVFEHTASVYEISAVNLHGTQGPHSIPVPVPSHPPSVDNRN